jgi:hypothetical protein
MRNDHRRRQGEVLFKDDAFEYAFNKKRPQAEARQSGEDIA